MRIRAMSDHASEPPPRTLPRVEQHARAERLRALHHKPKLLVLPNIWDPLGARMLEAHGFPAVATASASLAWSHGFDDGEQLPFETVLAAIARIAAAATVPLTADIESGYAEAPDALAANVRRVIEAGAVGVNIEDSRGEGRSFRSIDEQCKRIAAVRAMADAEGIPLVINARTDVFLDPHERPREAKLADAIERGRAYHQAGADCIYPIGPADAETARRLHDGIEASLNLYLSAAAAPLAELEAIGIARVSLGPGLLKASLTAMREVASDLLAGRSYDRFTRDAMTSDEVVRYVRGLPESKP